MFGVLEKRSFFQKGEFNVNDSVKNINNTLSLVLNPGGKEVNVVLSEPTLKLLSDYCNLKQFPIIKREKKNQNSNYDIAFEEIQDKVKQVVQNKNTKSLFEKGSNKEGILFENLLNELYKCFLEYDPDFQQSNDTSLKTLLELVSFDYISGIKDKFSINEINLEQLAEKISASQLLPLIVYRQPLNSDYNILKISARDQKYFKEKGIDVGERLRNVLSEARELVENKKYSENVDLGGGYEFPAILCLISLTSEEDFIKNIKNHESIIDLLKLPDDQNSDWGECFRDERGRTILHYLAYKNKTKVIEEFISKLDKENKQKVKELLTYQDNYGRTVYHAAAAANSKEALKSFLDYESVYFSSSDEKPSTKPDDYKRTPLHLAAMCDSVDTLKQLCYDSASSDWLFSAKDNYGRTPLHLAAMYNSIKALEYLSNKSANGETLHVKDDFGRTPLHIAAMEKQSDAVEILLENAANPSIRDQKGRLSIDLTLYRSNKPGVKIESLESTILKLVNYNYDILLSKDWGGVDCFGADQLTKKKNQINTEKFDINAYNFLQKLLGFLKQQDIIKPELSKSEQKQEPWIIQAIKSENKEARDEFIKRVLCQKENEESLNLSPLLNLSNKELGELNELIADNKDFEELKKAVLDYQLPKIKNIIVTGNLELVKKLIEDCNFVLKSKFSWREDSLIHFAEHQEVLDYLLEKGIDLKTTNDLGETVFHRLCIDGKSDLAESLLKHYNESRKDDIQEILQQKDCLGNTLLHLAALIGNENLTEQLVSYNSDPNLKGAAGLSPLHVAAAIGSVSVLEKLIGANGDVKNSTEDGITLLHSACQGVVDGKQACWDVVDYLLERKKDEEEYPFVANVLKLEPRDILDKFDWSYAEKYDDMLEKYGYYEVDESYV
ncbi:MAG TPA: ankyrin repeat domain-containing protein [Candidatus Megaira endosymbiont of Nemacystus decipiens]|nr:ankyrin repeat domain-containing protein [Candidatus Megaera endosymbiont of Nemacystus decipiens]